MRNTILVAALLLVTGLTAGCDKNHDPDSFWNGNNMPIMHLKSNIGLDMKNVQGFTLAPVKVAAQSAPAYRTMNGDCISVGDGSAGVSADTSCVHLFALSATGVVPVAIWEVQENEPHPGDPGYNPDVERRQTPQTIYNLGKFVLFVFTDNIQTEAGPCQMVILQKSNGAMYCSKDAVASCVGQNNGCFGMNADQIVKASADANIVYAMRMDQAFVRFDFSNPASAVATVLIDQTDGMTSRFEVNAGGDALVEFMGTNAQTVDLRYYKRTSGFAPMLALSTWNQGGSMLCTYAGPGTQNTDFYAVTPRHDGNNMNGTQLADWLAGKVLHLGLDMAGQATYTTYAADSNSWGMPYGGCPGRAQGNTADRHFVLWSSSSAPMLFESHNPQGAPAFHTLSGFTTVNRMYTCDSQVVLSGRSPAGTDIIARYDPVTAGTQAVINSIDYTISQVDVSPSCDITFGGRRASDNSRMIGNIKAGTTEVTLYTNALDGDVKQLVRIR